MSESVVNHPPLFVVGCGRSGTTMLRLMLDSHPDLAIPGEGHFIPYNYKIRNRFMTPEGLDAERLARRITATTHWQRWGVPEANALERVRALQRPDFADVIEALYMSYADTGNKVRWGDKTPIYVRQIPLLARLWPDARFVHVIRDGHDVALSYLSVPWGPTTIWEAARKWTKDVSAGRRAGHDLAAGKYLEVRYEDLVSDPGAELRKICALADLPFTTEMLEYHSDAGSRLQVQPNTTEFHQSATKPPTRGLRNWRTQMSRAQIEAFEALAGDTLEQLGYERLGSRVTRAKRAEVLARSKLLDLKAAGSKAKKRITAQHT
jgi:Sulfotransferase family